MDSSSILKRDMGDEASLASSSKGVTKTRRLPNPKPSQISEGLCAATSSPSSDQEKRGGGKGVMLVEGKVSRNRKRRKTGRFVCV